MTPSSRIAIALVVLVAAAPLPLGGNRPWAVAMLAVCAGLLLLWWSVERLRRPRPPAVPAWRIRFAAGAYLFAMAWAVLQVLPIGLAHPLWAEAAAALGAPAGSSISLDPEATWISLTRMTAYAAVFWLALQLGRSAERAGWMLTAIALALAAYAAYGLTLHALGIERILWLPKWAYIGDATGTFVNRNAFGAQMGAGLVLSLGMALRRLAIVLRPDAVDRDRHAGLALLWGAVAAVQFLALLATHSRGALAATAAAVVVLILALTVARMLRPSVAGLLLLLSAAIGGLLLLTDGEGVLARVAEAAAEIDGDRTHLFRLTILAIEGSPLTGYGLGAFEATFRTVRDLTLPRPVVYEFAHNIYLELALELGVPACAAAVLSVAALAGRCLRGLVERRRDRLFPAVALAVTVLFATHGLVDFSLFMPALAVLLAVLLGIGCAQSWSAASSLNAGR